MAADLLDEALGVGAQELEALIAGDVDLASELCEKRAALMERGWNMRTDDEDDLRPRLLALRSLQERLSEEGSRLKQEIQERLGQSKKQVRRMQGYGAVVNQAVR